MSCEIQINENGEVVLVESLKIKRVLKGKSLISFPENYVCIDIETTGLDPSYNDIIEIGAIKVQNNVIIDSFNSLIHIDFELDDFISQFTGITNDMLSEAPVLEEVLTQFKTFIGDNILLGHNVNFDINFLYDNFERVFEEPLKNDFVDTLRIARRVLTDLDHHRLIDVAEFYKIDSNVFHRSNSDCIATIECYKKLSGDVLINFGSYNEFIDSIKKKKYINVKDIKTDNTEFDISHPLYGKECVFTGVLEKMPRKDAMQVVVDLGGICGNGVNSKTNFLILGNNDYCPSIKGGKSSKHKKAEMLKLKGQDIEIISENVFYDLIDIS